MNQHLFCLKTISVELIVVLTVWTSPHLVLSASHIILFEPKSLCLVFFSFFFLRNQNLLVSILLLSITANPPSREKKHIGEKMRARNEEGAKSLKRRRAH